MNSFNYSISINASSKSIAQSKMKSLCALAESLSSKELEKLADIIKNDPVKTAIAKKALGV